MIYDPRPRTHTTHFPVSPPLMCTRISPRPSSADKGKRRRRRGYVVVR